jgi:O-antigen/teichoic acid export membrane protein
LQILEKDKYYFVILNVAISLSRFIRSFVFARVLDFKELGLISMVVTIVGFFGMFQIGLLNGGYRIFATNKSKSDESSVNNHIYSYFLFLTLALFLVLPAITYFTTFNDNALIIILSVVFGIITLVDNWIRNIFSAKMLFTELNKLELYSSLISFLFLITVFYWGIMGAFVVVFIKPFSFLLLAFLRNQFLLPTKLEFNLKRVKWILSFGFLPFLSGLVVVLGVQIEKWSIIYFLNLEELGKFYLPGMYAGIFLLVPLALNKIFFPRVIAAFTNHDFKIARKSLQFFTIICLLYVIIVFVFTYLFIEPMIAYLFPKHLIAIKYIWIIYPGLVAMVFVQPLQILFNAATRFKAIFSAQAWSTLLMLFLFLCAQYALVFTLDIVSYIKSIVLIFSLSYYLLYFLFYRHTIWHVNLEKEKYINFSTAKNDK